MTCAMTDSFVTSVQIYRNHITIFFPEVLRRRTASKSVTLISLKNNHLQATLFFKSPSLREIFKNSEGSNQRNASNTGQVAIRGKI